MKYLKLYESFNYKEFLGYHSSKRNLNNGEYLGVILNSETYIDIIRYLYMELISDYDEILENNDIEKMNNVFIKNNYRFTYVSDKPINSSIMQNTKYKYGNYLYKVYGTGEEILITDPNEINATIVASKNPLYLEKQN